MCAHGPPYHLSTTLLVGSRWRRSLASGGSLWSAGSGTKSEFFDVARRSCSTSDRTSSVNQVNMAGRCRSSCALPATIVRRAGPVRRTEDRHRAGCRAERSFSMIQTRVRAHPDRDAAAAPGGGPERDVSDRVPHVATSGLPVCCCGSPSRRTGTPRLCAAIIASVCRLIGDAIHDRRRFDGFRCCSGLTARFAYDSSGREVRACGSFDVAARVVTGERAGDVRIIRVDDACSSTDRRTWS